MRPEQLVERINDYRELIESLAPKREGLKEDWRKRLNKIDALPLGTIRERFHVKRKLDKIELDLGKIFP